MQITEQEKAVRVDLAAAYRLIAHFNLDDGIYTHISARVPGTDDQFLINPFGMPFRDITATSLVKIDVNGNLIGESTYDVNPAGFTIHSAVHMARHDAACVLHTHTEAGMAVASLECGLMPFNQWALQFYNRVAYHEFEGLALDLDERKRLAEDLGTQATVLILRNHGLLTVGRSVPEAVIFMLALERACRTQLKIQSSGQPVHPIPPEICERTLAQMESGGGNPVDGQFTLQQRAWRALLKRLEPSPASSFRD